MHRQHTERIRRGKAQPLVTKQRLQTIEHRTTCRCAPRQVAPRGPHPYIEGVCSALVRERRQCIPKTA